MPGHFTHMYTARRVADLLADPHTTSFVQAGTALGAVADGRSPAECARIMREWERFTAIGAVGPDLFFFCQDYSSGPLAVAPYQDDLLMLAMATWYWVDAAKEDDYEPLLILLAEVNGTFAEIARVLIKLKKLWDEFVKAWNATIGRDWLALAETSPEVSRHRDKRHSPRAKGYVDGDTRNDRE